MKESRKWDKRITVERYKDDGDPMKE